MRLPDLLDGLDRPIAFYPQLIRLAGSVNAALLLCQLAYWHGKQRDPDGWIFKRCAIAPEDPYGEENVENQSIEAETGLKYHDQLVARRLLRSRGFLQERYARSIHKFYFRLDIEAIQRAWYGLQDPDVAEPRMAAGSIPSAPNEDGELHSAKLPTAQSEDGECLVGPFPSSGFANGEVHRAQVAPAESADGTFTSCSSLIGTSTEYTETTPETSAETTREAAPAASRLDPSGSLEQDRGGPLPKGPDEARELPEMQIFEQVCGRLPRVSQYRSVLAALKSLVQDRGEEHLVEYLAPFWTAWMNQRRSADAAPYDPGGVIWLTEWALSGKIPTEPEVAQTTPDDGADQRST